MKLLGTAAGHVALVEYLSSEGFPVSALTRYLGDRGSPGVVEASGLLNEHLAWLSLGGIGTGEALPEQAMPPVPEPIWTSGLELEPVTRHTGAHSGMKQGSRPEEEVSELHVKKIALWHCAVSFCIWS